MDKVKVYTIGYGGREPQDILRLARKLFADVWDIRFSARSRNAKWRQDSLARLLAGRYRHMMAWGNRNYRGGPVELVNFEAGLEMLAYSSRNVILMCACRDHTHCHRTHVAELLREHGYEPEELGETKPPGKQLSMVL